MGKPEFGPFTTSTVGSFPQTKELRAWRNQLSRGRMAYLDYRGRVEDMTDDWVRWQEEVGLDVLVDGEFFRDDMAAFFGRKLGGEAQDFVSSFENRRYRPIRYSQEITRVGAITVTDFEVLRQLTDRPVKAVITGPATLADWGIINNEVYYEHRGKFRMDFAGELRAEIADLKTAGARILQVDEPALTTKMGNFDQDLAAIKETVQGAEDMYKILHICYSDLDALDQAFPAILKLPFDQIHMEMANRGYSLLELIKKYGFGGKDIGLGVVDVHNDRIEGVEEIVSGVERTLEYFEPGQIWLTPDCGLKDRSEEVTKEKLAVMVEAAQRCRVLFE